MATESAIELLEKKRKDLDVLEAARAILVTLATDATGVDILITRSNGETFSSAGLRNALLTKGAQEDTLFSTLKTAIEIAISATFDAGSLSEPVDTLITAYNADIAAE